MSLFSFLKIPIIQAPMEGGITTPELVAGVSNIEALGSLGAGYMTAQEIKAHMQKIKQLTYKPFQVNLFVPEKNPSHQDTTSMKKKATAIMG